MAVGQHQWYHFGVGAPPILVYFSGDWDVDWGYGALTHSHMERVGFFEPGGDPLWLCRLARFTSASSASGAIFVVFVPVAAAAAAWKSQQRKAHAT